MTFKSIKWQNKTFNLKVELHIQVPLVLNGHLSNDVDGAGNRCTNNIVVDNGEQNDP